MAGTCSVLTQDTQGLQEGALPRCGCFRQCAADHVRRRRGLSSSRRWHTARPRGGLLHKLAANSACITT